MKLFKITVIILIVTIITIFILVFLSTDSNVKYTEASIYNYTNVYSKTTYDVKKIVRDESKSVAGINGTSGSSSSDALACPYGDLIVKYGNEIGIDPLLIAAIISQESDFDPHAKGAPGIYGLMQISRGAAEDVNEVWPADPEEPNFNIRIGTKYFKFCLDLRNGDIATACAAYNVGPYASAAKINNDETNAYRVEVPNRYEAYKNGSKAVGTK